MSLPLLRAFRGWKLPSIRSFAKCGILRGPGAQFVNELRLIPCTGLHVRISPTLCNDPSRARCGCKRPRATHLVGLHAVTVEFHLVHPAVAGAQFLGADWAAGRDKAEGRDHVEVVYSYGCGGQDRCRL